ncbi:MAG: hypothetical protein AAF197_03390 [Pseudomonadota bacterium]
MIRIAILLVAIAALAYYSYKAPRLTSILIWTVISTTFGSAALLLALPGDFAEKAILMSLSVPVSWVALQFWCYWDQSHWRVLFGNIAICVVGGIVVWLTEPLV